MKERGSAPAEAQIDPRPRRGKAKRGRGCGKDRVRERGQNRRRATVAGREEKQGSGVHGKTWERPANENRWGEVGEEKGEEKKLRAVERCGASRILPEDEA